MVDMPAKLQLRRINHSGLKPGAIFMGVAGMIAVGFGLVAALQLSQMSQDQQTQASGEKLCTQAGGYPEKANKGYSGYCICPSGEKVKPSGKCANGPTLVPTNQKPQVDDFGDLTQPQKGTSKDSPQPTNGGSSGGSPVTRPAPTPRPINQPGFGPTVKQGTAVSSPTPMPSPLMVKVQ